MIVSFREAYKLEIPEITPIDMDSFCCQNIELFNAEWKEFGTGDVKAAGLPWSIDLHDGTGRESGRFADERLHE